MKSTFILSLLTLCLFACSTAQQHRRDVSADDGEKVSVGTVQREIREGMSGADVARVLGSPNIVTTDEERREVWIYDRIATERVYSTDSGGVSALILGGGLWGDGGAGGAGSAGVSGSAGAASTSQKTLTIIIKFDKNSRVRDFAYHTSRF